LQLGVESSAVRVPDALITSSANDHLPVRADHRQQPAKCGIFKAQIRCNKAAVERRIWRGSSGEHPNGTIAAAMRRQCDPLRRLASSCA